ncbi:MBL fold metallo-hydrolase [Leeia sp. TBRC 13508]|uniref:MBL fold metallo-hydrolase n=1 Tax=Leeia speluncae TaxID=2884804 RepID=A0ABS8D9W3_9NEIS|nr:MBL fold metallo-hydrolase [Leeia speluncae]MCB6185003.1 MBL fold metallo-hydrolase [Leeia speluncae]
MDKINQTNNGPRPSKRIDAKYQNFYTKPSIGGWATLKLLWQFFRKPAYTVPQGQIPVTPLTKEQIEQAPELSAFRLGHSTILLKIQQKLWLTDPVFSKRASPFAWMGPKRFHQPPISIDALPAIEGVILSHNHYDHLDKEAVLALNKKVKYFLTPIGVGDHLEKWGIEKEKIRQLDWWESIHLSGVAFHATPAQHFSGRGLFDGDQTLWCSWSIFAENTSIFFSGDTGYFDGFKEIGNRLGPFDLTMIETGAYDDRWAFVHMKPEQTVQAHLDVKGKTLLPIHNGTFDLALHPWQEPFERVLVAASEKGVALSFPSMGEQFSITKPNMGSFWWRIVDQIKETKVPCRLRHALCKRGN